MAKFVTEIRREFAKIAEILGISRNKIKILFKIPSVIS